MRGRDIATILVLLVAIAIVIGPLRARAGEPALTIADLAAYRAALSGSASARKGETPPVAVGFRELWDRPEAYQGKRVRVQARVARRFHQGAFGTFPQLAEVWAVSPSGDPFCLVYPEPKGRSPRAPEPTGTVRFVGTFLKQVRYEGRDGARLAPLIVGTEPPTALGPEPVAATIASPSIPWLDWTIGLLAAAVVVVVLASQYLRRPVRLRRGSRLNPGLEPPPVFEEPAEPRS